MNWSIIQGKWTELRGELRKKWGRLTDSDYDEIAGDKDKLIGRLQQRYGYAKDEAERQADSVLSSVTAKPHEHANERSA